MERGEAIARFLDTVGDQSGTFTATGDYSSTETEFKAVPAAGQTMFIEELLVTVEDAGTFRAEHYGALGAALTNGIHVRKRDASGTIVQLTCVDPVQGNAGWGIHAFDVDVKTWGAGNSLLLVRWRFPAPLRLDGDAGQYVAVVLNDDFSGLVDHRFKVQGWWG